MKGVTKKIAALLLGEIDGAELAEIRQRAILETARYEMGPVKTYFGKGR